MPCNVGDHYREGVYREVLEKDGYRPSQVDQLHLANIDAVDQDLSLSDIVYPRDQVEDSALA